MQLSNRVTAVLMCVVLLAAGCGGVRGGAQGPLVDDSASDGEVLSSCEPAGEAETTMVVEPSGRRPPVAAMEDAVGGNPDAEFMVEELQADGRSREEALHKMYAQVVGDRLLADARQLAGFVTGAYARPLEGEPFELAFSGPVPDGLQPDAYDLASFGLEVTTGASGLDHEAMSAAFEAADEAGMQTLSASGDEVAGTGRIVVVDATDEQLAAWEQVVDDPSRWCLVRAARTVPCDDSVIADAEAQAARQGEVLAVQQGTEPPSGQRAEKVRRSYLGMTLEVARQKASQEGRPARVVVQDGVELPVTDDLVPRRLNLTVCDDVVVDAGLGP